MERIFWRAEDGDPCSIYVGIGHLYIGDPF